MGNNLTIHVSINHDHFAIWGWIEFKKRQSLDSLWKQCFKLKSYFSGEDFNHCGKLLRLYFGAGWVFLQGAVKGLQLRASMFEMDRQ